MWLPELRVIPREKEPHWGRRTGYITIMKGTKVQTLGGRAVAGARAWLVAWAIMAGLVSRSHTLLLARRGSGRSTCIYLSSSRGMQLANPKIAVQARNAAIRVYIDTAWSTKLVKAITTLLVELLPCFPAQAVWSTQITHSGF